jgi:hypothetical protein
MAISVSSVIVSAKISYLFWQWRSESVMASAGEASMAAAYGGNVSVMA